MASNSSSSREYVGFWKRCLASVIDAMIAFAVIVPLALVVPSRQFWDMLFQLILPAVAVIAFWRYRGATPGKIEISARIVDAQSFGPPSTGRLVARYFAYLVSTLPLFLGFIWIAFDRRKQGFHDKIAGTVVIYDDD